MLRSFFGQTSLLQCRNGPIAGPEEHGGGTDVAQEVGRGTLGCRRSWYSRVAGDSLTGQVTAFPIEGGRVFQSAVLRANYRWAVMTGFWRSCMQHARPVDEREDEAGQRAVPGRRISSM